MAEWTNQERGPMCSCGGPMVVMSISDGDWGMMCFFHTTGEGVMFKLPSQKPDDLSANPEEWDMAMLTAIARQEQENET